MQRIAPHKTAIFVHIAIYLLVSRQAEPRTAVRGSV